MCWAGEGCLAHSDIYHCVEYVRLNVRKFSVRKKEWFIQKSLKLADLGMFSSLVTIGDWLNRLIINDFNIEDANMKKNCGTILFIIAVCGAALWEHHQLIDKPKVPIKQP